MNKYNTRACNFYFGQTSKKKVKNKLAIPLHGNNLISFDTIEILSRKNRKKININKINSLNSQIKQKLLTDIKIIKRKKRKLITVDLKI